MCGMQGHNDKFCIKNKKDGSGKSVKQIIKVSVIGKYGLEVKTIEETTKKAEPKEGNTEAAKENQIAGTVKEVEEGELVENWEDVTPGKGSGSPNLKYGQVKILTPDRFSAFLEVENKGDAVNQVEKILSIEEEIIVEKANEEVRKEDTIKVSEDGEEGKNETIGGKSGMKETKEDHKNDQIGKSIAGIQHWPDLAN